MPSAQGARGGKFTAIVSSVSLCKLRPLLGKAVDSSHSPMPSSPSLEFHAFPLPDVDVVSRPRLKGGSPSQPWRTSPRAVTVLLGVHGCCATHSMTGPPIEPGDPGSNAAVTSLTLSASFRGLDYSRRRLCVGLSVLLGSDRSLLFMSSQSWAQQFVCSRCAWLSGRDMTRMGMCAPGAVLKVRTKSLPLQLVTGISP